MGNKTITELPIVTAVTLGTKIPVVENDITSQLSVGNLPQSIIAISRDSNPVAINTSTPTIITDMTSTPLAGSYLLNFSSIHTIDSTANETEQAVTDLQTLYDGLMALTATVTTRSLTYGNGETLTEGVYALAGATNITGTLTLDAEGDSTKQFVFRCTGAFTTGASATIVLTGGALSSNVWFISEGAASTGASTVFKGSIIANQAAVSTGASTSFEGRMFTITGAIGIGAASTFTTPTGTSQSTIGTLNEFSLFTGVGNITNTGATEVSLSIGTDSGTITGFDATLVGGALLPSSNSSNGKFRIGVYVDGVLIPNSLRSNKVPSLAAKRTPPINLQTVVTITNGQTIDIRAYSELGQMTVGPVMCLSMIPVLLQ